MSTYLEKIFTDFITRDNVKNIFEIGSRDILDAISISNYYENSTIYAFECNPEGLVECRRNLASLDENKRSKIKLIEKAVHTENGFVKFYPFDVTKYNNIGASSMYKIDFSGRPPYEGDIFFGQFPPGFVQKEIQVESLRLDTFCDQNQIKYIDLICMDLQGHELVALKSLGDYIKNVKYIITESSYKSTYVGGSSFFEINSYLSEFGFDFVISDKTREEFPSDKYFTNYTGGTSELNSLFINRNLFDK